MKNSIVQKLIEKSKSKAKSKPSLAKSKKSNAVSKKTSAKSHKSQAKSKKSKAITETVNLYDLLFESFSETSIEEMPIQQFKNVGDWEKRSSFKHDIDRRLLTSPKAVEKIYKQWEKTPFDFEIYVVNDPRVNKSQFREVGQVNMDFVRNEMKITPEEIPDNNDNAITIIFTNNVGAERYMASGWILAHRLGHALSRGNGSSAFLWREFTESLRKQFAIILRDVYGIDVYSKTYDFADSAAKDKILKYVAQQIGTMKSARDKNLRNWFEFAYELLAQYLLTGKITFNELPKNIVTGIRGWAHKNTRYARDEDMRIEHNENLQNYIGQIEDSLKNVLDSAIGTVFVM